MEAKPLLLSLKGECGGKTIYFAGKIHLWEDKNGDVHPYIHTVRPQISKGEYKGYAFSKEEQDMLLNNGQISNPINLTFGEKTYACLVGVDPETKEVIHTLCSNIYISDEILGRRISLEEKQKIQQGQEIFLQGFTNKSTGEKFDAVVSFSFSKNSGEGGLTFKKPTPNKLQELRIASGLSEGPDPQPKRTCKTSKPIQQDNPIKQTTKKSHKPKL